MGTKNEVGKFDCYGNAEDDEPMFVLLARDPLAPMLVKLWAEIRNDEKSNEAFECAEKMIDWKSKNRPNKQIKNVE